MTTSTIPTAGGRGRTGIADRLRAAPRTLWRGREADAAWVRPAFLGLLVVAAALYLVNLTANGYANAFYSAAVQAGSTNWEAFLYGSSDAGNSITVDKPPAALWVMALSVRLFGLSSFSILLPQALMGVATVALVYLIVRRHFAPQAALIAGAATAFTPVAVLMFRFNNPDALLVLLITLATYLTLRAVEDGRIRWLLWAGAAVGFAFLTKQLQAFLILPVLVGVVLFASPRRIGVRFAHLFGALGALVVSAGWWVAIVELVPASMRPYIGGSQDNSFLELTFGYNGLGRLTGNETGSVTGGGGTTTGGGMWGETGPLRLFTGEFGTQIAWLLPAALALLVVGLVVTFRRPRVDPARATVLLLGGTLLVTALAFSFGAGIIHPYYSVALAPAIGGLVGVGGWLLWERRAALWARIVLAVVVLGTTAWSFALMSEASTFLPWLRAVVVIAGVLAAATVLAAPHLRVRAVATAGVALALVAALAAPAAWSVDTVTTAHTGSLPTAGPAVSGGRGGFGGGQGGPGAMRGGFGQQNGTGTQGGQPPQGFGQGGPGGTGGQGFGGQGGPGGATGTQGAPGATGTQGGTGARTGGAGGLLGGAVSVNAALTSALQADASQYTWAAAAVGSQNAANYQLASGEAVMPIGGFNGSDPSPTLAEFQQYVADGRIHYFIGSGSTGGRSNGGSSISSEIAAWVASNYTASTVGGVTVYDLSGGGSSTAGA